MSSRALDRAAAVVREAGGSELLERLHVLDRLGTTAPARPGDEPPLAKPAPAERPDYDVVLAGGGLSLLYAPLLAARGARVAVFERHRAGVAHREWNASAAELEALVTAGLLDRRELETLIVARYASGFCRFGSGPAYEVREVLDCAADAGALLRLARRKAEAAGVHFYDGHELRALAAGPAAVRLRFAAGAVAREVTARLVVDGRGAQSSFATADLVCPTVGGVLRGIASGDGPDEVQSDRGEILVTTEGLDGGRQHLWEAFPGRDGEVTVYLFYYEARAARAPGALLALYARFFERLGGYKRGCAVLVRPTFGYIPGWSRLAPPPAPPSPRVVLVGDAAARHSPLTLCGFGATLRSLAPATTTILAALDAGTRSSVAVEDRRLHRGTGALAWLLARPPRAGTDPGVLNALLDAAFGTVYEMGQEAYAALLRDEMEMSQLIEFLRRTAARRPQVYRDVLAGLGLYRTARWGLSLARGLRQERSCPTPAGRDRATARPPSAPSDAGAETPS